MAEKKYYWLKLKEGFFDEKEIKKLRKIAGGDTYTIIYLKLLLISLRDEGKLYFDGLEDTFADELALVLDEDVENVKVTISYLLQVGLMREVNPVEAELTMMPEMIGSEGASAERMRRRRERLKELGITEQPKALPEQSDGKASQSDTDVTKSDTEIDIETDSDSETDQEQKISAKQIGDEFEILWKLYPNRKGKKNALASYERARSKGTTFEEVKEGIEAYVNYIAVTKSEQYIKYGSTFFNQESWQDDWSVSPKGKEIKAHIDDGLDEIF